MQRSAAASPTASRGGAGAASESELQPLHSQQAGNRQRSNVVTPAGGSRLRGSQPTEQSSWTIMRFMAFLPHWFKLVKGWYIGPARVQAWKHAVPCVVLAIAKTLMIVQISYVQRRFSTNLSEKNADGFYAAAWEFVYIILFAAPMFASLEFAVSRLKIMWRQWMTEQVLAKYFKHKAYFQLKMDPKGIDNPDQRICDDISSFTDGSTVVLMTAMDKIFQILAVLKVLWEVSPSMVNFIVVYTFLGTVVTVTGFGKPLMRLFYEMLHCEGDMRFTLVRLGENAEAVAFYGGGPQEHATVKARLRSVVDVTLQRLWWLTGLGFWSNCYGYATILVPSLVIGPRYFRGEVDFGTISQAGYLFRQLLDALSAVIDRLHSICNLAAETDRLHAINAELDAAGLNLKGIVHMQSVSNEGLALENVTVTTPRGGLTLAEGLSFQVFPGQSLLIMGTSGCGKSSLMRAVSSLWTYGAGVIRTPEISEMFFLPQKAYMPLGSLRQQLTFPSGIADSNMLGHRAGLGHTTDEELQGLMDDVQLSHLATRVRDLEAVMDWASMLSQGEQQRVAFLRLLLHRPRLAFLDEATSAVDNKIEHILYTLLKKHCKCYISIGHRLQLLDYHSHVLFNAGPGSWQLMTTQEYRATSSA